MIKYLISLNDYPYAVWWGCDNGEGVVGDNPTVSLAGFAINYTDKNSSLYLKATDIIKSAVSRFMQSPTHEMHTLYCYMELYEYRVSEQIDFVDVKLFKCALLMQLGGPFAVKQRSGRLNTYVDLQRFLINRIYCSIL